MLKSFEGKVVAITGAASGIGRALSLELARRGAVVALADIDEEGLAHTTEAVRRVALAREQTVAYGVSTCWGTKRTAEGGTECKRRRPFSSAARVDVADRYQVHEWAEQVVAEHGRVNMIVNNAGVALGAQVTTMSYEDLAWIMGINFWGVVHGTKEFLPHLEASGEGHIVNLSSVFGLIGIPTQSAYSAAKFAVRGFTESLRIELDIAGSKVSCSCVYPGGIKTAIARNARVEPATAAMAGGEDGAKAWMEKMFITSPEAAARAILAGVERNRRRILVGYDARVFLLLSC
ncbi:MAG: SDR family NAD(P)-dependent oxidoreductase, partial [Actinobacteria bacterium]|nr:SDR family NAD(P)-dependent oxidoreductase [Actinomycetota bacterium]